MCVRMTSQELKPSFRVHHFAARRVRALAYDIHGERYPAMAINQKPAGYRFAESHGLCTPTRLAHYSKPDEIDWTQLPDSFAIKTAGGTSARGVLLLEGRPGGYVDLLADTEPLTPADIVADLSAKAEAGKISSELVVEELLRSPYPAHDGPPPDVKLYCFHGTVGLVMVIDRLSRKRLRHRYFWPDGTDVGDDARVDATNDPAVPEPLHVKELVAAGETLSAALPEPCVRIDFYEQPDRIVFGEITLSPGGSQEFRADIDEHLGSLWEQAEARLRVESVRSGLRDPGYGPQPRKP